MFEYIKVINLYDLAVNDPEIETFVKHGKVFMTN